MSGSPAARNAAPVSSGTREEVVLTRFLDAPRALVWEAWSSYEHLARWWGPKGFTTPRGEVALVPGGPFTLVMKGPDGREYPMEGTVHEAEPPARLVWSAVVKGVTEVWTVVTFDEEKGKTRLTVRQTVPQDPDMARGQKQGWTESLERLAAALAVPAASVTASDATAREIATTRVFDAPRDLVWRVWTEAEHVRRWWGPNGFTNTIHEMDVRKGGVWSFVMHGPDGTNYRNRIDYTEVIRPERLEWDHGPAPKFHVTVTFAEEGERTRITMRMVFATAAERDHTIEKFGALEGQKQTMDRLDTYLAATAPGAEFTQTRTFDAPREVVFAAWTDLDRLREWWGPKGFTWVSGTLDPRPGGVFHYGMKGPDGQTMWGRFVFREVVAPRRLVFVVSFSDERGGVTRAPMSADWPLEVLNVVTFEEAAGKTTLTLWGRPIHATEAEKRTFAGARGSMEQGFKGTLDQLAAHLAKARG